MSKYLTVSELEQQEPNTPIWALNTSAESRVKHAGDIHIGIPKINGTKVDDLKIPQTWLPICLTDMIPRDQLMSSSEFRNAVNAKLIRIITADHAEQVEAQDGAFEERERMQEKERLVEETTAAKLVSTGAEIIAVSDLTDVTRGEVVAADPSAHAPSPVDSSFKMFVAALQSLEDIEALNRIRGRGTFNRAEIKHMMTELKGKTKVTAFLRRADEAMG